MLNSSTKVTALAQVREIIHRHLVTMSPWTSCSGRLTGTELQVVEWIEELSDLCDIPRSKASREQQKQACVTLSKLTYFLKVMNQDLGNGFKHTPIGVIWATAHTWCMMDVSPQLRVTRDQAWDLIDPAIPDALEDLGDNLFEAKWASPVPMMDLEILKHTAGIDIVDDGFEPDEMPHGLGIRFRIVPDISLPLNAGPQLLRIVGQ